MLQNGLQVIAQYKRQGDTSLVCRGFGNVRSVTPVQVVFIAMDERAAVVAAQLGEEFCRRMLGTIGVEEFNAPFWERPPSMPCHGSLGSCFDCHATRDSDCRKLLVLVGGDGTCTPSRTLTALPLDAQRWIGEMASNDQWEILPVLPGAATIGEVLPSELRHLNVSFFWSADPATEVLPGVFQRAGLAPEDYRIFISYIRKETSELAEQLHDALTRQGFSVFLDRFSVPVGVNFQERLMQELTDKGMMVLLHSADVGKSHWVEEEIAQVTKYRLGLYVLRLPGVPERSTLAPDHSREIVSAEWDGALRQLQSGALAQIVHEIKRVHHTAHQRQLQRLANALIAAVYDPLRGRHRCTLRPQSNGLFTIHRPSGGDVPIFLTSRPPELRDFYYTHRVGGLAGGGNGAIIAPAPFVMAQRRAWFDWLGGLAHLRHLDEGQLSNTVSDIIAGNF